MRAALALIAISFALTGCAGIPPTVDPLHTDCATCGYPLHVMGATNWHRGPATEKSIKDPTSYAKVELLACSGDHWWHRDYPRESAVAPVELPLAHMLAIIASSDRLWVRRRALTGRGDRGMASFSTGPAGPDESEMVPDPGEAELPEARDTASEPESPQTGESEPPQTAGG